MDDFEVFEKYHSRSVKELYVTVQKRGILSLNRASFRAMGSPEFAELLFSRSKRVIGIRPAKSPTGRTVPVRKQGQSESYLIAGLTFTKEYDIDCSISRRYIATMQKDMLMVDLNSPSTKAPGPRLSRNKDLQTELEGFVSEPEPQTDAIKAVEQTYYPIDEQDTEATTDKSVDNASAGLDTAINAILQLDEEEREAFLEYWSERKKQGSKKAK